MYSNTVRKNLRLCCTFLQLCYVCSIDIFPNILHPPLWYCHLSFDVLTTKDKIFYSAAVAHFTNVSIVVSLKRKNHTYHILLIWLSFCILVCISMHILREMLTSKNVNNLNHTKWLTDIKSFGLGWRDISYKMSCLISVR